MSSAVTAAPLAGENRLGSGQFFGGVHKRRVMAGAIFTDLRHPVPRKLPEHSHELPFFGLLLNGYYGERYGREQKQFAPLSLMFRPAGIPHQDEIAPGGLRFFHLELHATWKTRLAECSGDLSRAKEDAQGGPMFWLAMRLFRESLAAESVDEFSVTALLAELVGQAARLVAEEKKEAPAWLGRVLAKLREEHCRTLTLEELSTEAGVHPVHLSRVFRRFQREGIAEYTHRLRARTAATLLRNPETPLAEIGFACGFADQSHFTRSFRRITGHTPHAFRALVS